MNATVFHKEFNLGNLYVRKAIDYRNGLYQSGLLIGTTRLVFNPIPPPLEGGDVTAYTLRFTQDRAGYHSIIWPRVLWNHYGKHNKCIPNTVQSGPGWTTAFRIYCMPIGLCADNLGSFEPGAFGS